MDLREEILGIKDCDEKIITIKKWNSRKVLVKAFTAGARYELISQSTLVKDGEADIDGKKLMILTVIESAYDPATGKRLFTIADYETLMAKSYGAIEAIARTANELSGVGDDAIEESEKN